jgi:hypothetical protein
MRNIILNFMNIISNKIKNNKKYSIYRIKRYVIEIKCNKFY